MIKVGFGILVVAISSFMLGRLYGLRSGTDMILEVNDTLERMKDKFLAKIKKAEKELEEAEKKQKESK